MKLKIKISDLMDSSKSPLGSIEDRLLRVPKDLREELGLELGAFLTLKGKQGTVYLQVYEAYKDDVANEVCLFVSKNTWYLLDIDHVSKLQASEDILIGCDPEMFIMDRGAKMAISAAHFFHHYGEIGNDNGLLELRPRPSTDPKEVTKTIDELITKAALRIKNRTIFRNRDLFLMAASNVNGTSAGFHVHFGLPAYILRQDAERVWILTNMVTILDYYVGIPAILPEGDADSLRRSQKFGTRYGKPGDFRAEDGLTFEYRVAGGHLLRHPVYTEGLLAISKLVMSDTLGRLEKMSNKDKSKMFFSKYDDLRKAVYPNLPERLEVYESITSNTIARALGHVETIANDYSKMVGFDKYKKAIEHYLSLALASINGQVKISDNLEENWRSINENRHQQMAVL